MDATNHTAFSFGGFEVDLHAQELRRRGRKVRLCGQPFQILALLLERPREVVTRAELRERLWASHTIADFDNGLNIAIKRLRQALGDSAANPKMIETLPRVGYRFVHEVRLVQAQALPGAEARPSSRQPVPSTPKEVNGPRTTLDAVDGGLGLPSRMGAVSEPATDSRNPSMPTSAPVPRVAEAVRARRVHRQGQMSRAVLLIVASTAALLAFSALASNLWLGSPHGIVERRLTENFSDLPVTAAAISPDGKYVAYADLTGVYVRLVDTDESRPLSVPRSFRVDRLAWFPGGTKLLASGRLAQKRQSSVWVTSAFGGTSFKLRDDAGDASPSPDGSQVAFVTGSGQELWMMGAQGDEPHRLFASAAGDNLAGPLWFPDGRRILCTRLHLTEGKAGRIKPNVIVESRDSRNGSAATVLADFGLTGAVVLSGGRLAFCHVKGSLGRGEPGLWETKTDLRTGAAAGKPTLLKNWLGETGIISSLTASADGKRIAFIRSVEESDVYVGELSNKGKQLKNVRRLTLDDRNDFPAAWTPDSKAVLFHSDRNGSFDIFRQRLDQSAAEPIVTSSEDEVGPIAVSPYGTDYWYVVLPRDWRDTTVRPVTLMRIGAAGGPPRKALYRSGLYSLRCARVAAGGCMLSETGSDETVFYRFDPVNGKGVELVRVALGSASRDLLWDLSPDGSHIATMIRGEARIRVLSLAGKPAREVPVQGWTSDEHSGLSWSADGKGWYLSAQSADGTDLLGIDGDGHINILRHLTATTETQVVPSPDGRYLAYSQSRRLSNAWTLEGF
jgi:Tol biopolymer transport system component/DNA-binding winged helix-turn-helix (wHTH) protein